MRTTTILTAMALVATISLSASVAGGDADAQEGENSDCLDYNVLYEEDGVYSPLAQFVDTTPGASYTVSSSDGVAFVDFYNDDGRWIGWNQGSETGTVPEDAATGTICIGLTGAFPDAPYPGTTWTYTE